MMFPIWRFLSSSLNAARSRLTSSSSCARWVAICFSKSACTSRCCVVGGKSAVATSSAR
jgi:hypothetical protein